MLLSARYGVPTGAIERILHVKRDDCAIACAPSLVLECYFRRLGDGEDSIQRRPALPVTELVTSLAKPFTPSVYLTSLLRIILSSTLPAVSSKQIGLYTGGSPGGFPVFGSKTKLCHFHLSGKRQSSRHFCMTARNSPGAN